MDAGLTAYKPQTIEDVRRFVRQAVCVQPRGGGSKTALSQPRFGWEVIDLSALSGLLEYQPDEFTFTALAGTPLEAINCALAEHGQYLPFDPLLAGRGATLGGAVAANTPGPGRYHYGGVRDFLIGVRLVTGEGQLVRGGGKVVKNAAGFDLPKLMVGSLGALGVMVELSFKVFPRPQTYATLQVDYPDLPAALAAMQRAASARLDLDALDLEAAADGYRLWVRLGGLQTALPQRLERLTAAVGGGQVLSEAEEALAWEQTRDLAWVPPDWLLAKVALTPGRIPALEERLKATGAPVLRRYSANGQMAWLALEGAPQFLDAGLRVLNLTGLVLLGGTDAPHLGEPGGRPFYQRVKQALDPARRLAEV